MASISSWLATVKPAYSVYSQCFEDVGIDDFDEIAEIDDDILAKLEAALTTYGCKAMHWKKIRAAIAEEGTKAEKGVAPPNRPAVSAPSATDSPLKNRLLTKADNNYAGGKQYACFLSHHKEACAMEARFLKGWYRW